MAKPTSSTEVRRAFSKFYTDRGHKHLTHSRIVPADPTMLFTIAGMVQFKDYFTGKSVAPYSRVTTVQPCVRTVDIDIIGTTDRHLTLFEMLGNFSFGDYFKEQSIEWAWTFYTDILGIDPDRLWITVHTQDDDAEEIWASSIGVDRTRIQRLEEDNFWKMGEIGPCGPCSELYFDRGPQFGPQGGPGGGGSDRYIEIGNLVFMQFERQVPNGPMTSLPSPCVDFGGGLERVLAVVQGADSVFETDLFSPIISQTQRLVNRDIVSEDFSKLRIMADHARAVSFMISEGVVPSNEGRGYVLRRLIRRAILKSAQLGIENGVMTLLTKAVLDTLGSPYPGLVSHHDLIEKVVSREEEVFRKTLRSGSQILEDHLDEIEENGEISGEVAFLLHDTHGFPLELTRELAGERGVTLDLEGFERAMDDQKSRARSATKSSILRGTTQDNIHINQYRRILDKFGPTVFVGYSELDCESEIIEISIRDPGDHEHQAISEIGGFSDQGDTGEGKSKVVGKVVDVFAITTPFYAESGGQLGDRGAISTSTGRAKVFDTTFVLPGLIRHTAIVEEGDIHVGAMGRFEVDQTRRASLRRNHTSTHLLHWGLRETLGTHVHQQGSLVAPDRLRFDFSHFEGLGAEQIRHVESLVNSRVVFNYPVETLETTMDQATSMGAMAFFGDKYGEIVRVVKASESVELCGGTHVDSLGMIGPIKIVNEGSIGSGIRRIEAISGSVSMDYFQEVNSQLEQIARGLKVVPSQVPQALEKLLDRLEMAEKELRTLQQQKLQNQAKHLAEKAQDGVVVARLDGMDANDLRELATSVRSLVDIKVVVLASKVEPGKVSLVSALSKGVEGMASDIIGDAARLLGGGVGKGSDLAIAGGKKDEKLDDALELARAKALSGDF